MPLFVIPNGNFINNVSPVDATTTNANNLAIQNAINGIDNTNVGTLGFYASQIKPTNAAQAIFGGAQNYQMPQSLIIPSGSTYAFGLIFTTATGLGVYAGTGVPSFSAPNGSLAIRYDGPGVATNLYINTSGASSTGTTWTPVGNLSSVYSAQFSSIIAYTTTSSETNASPGTMATVACTVPATSPGANNNWRAFVEVVVSAGTTGAISAATPIGIGTATAGATPYATFGKNANTPIITAGNCRSDVVGVSMNTVGVAEMVKYSAIFANATTPSFTALMGANSVASAQMNGYISVIFIPN